jgi:hypothetical protein
VEITPEIPAFLEKPTVRLQMVKDRWVNFSKILLSKKFDPKLMPVAFDQFEATSELLIQFHQEKMEWAGKKYKGFRQREIKKLSRVTHFYSCKEQLDNSIDIECVSCNWILCWCGACGCGFDRSGFTLNFSSFDLILQLSHVKN